MFVLVRHAPAVSRRRWPGPDHDRPLNGRGQERARSLVTDLEGLGITRLLSSPTVRCRHTLLLLSEELLAPVEPVEALALGAPLPDLMQLLDSPDLEHAVLCTHGETLRALATAWESTWPTLTGQPAPDVARTRKGGYWVVERYNTPSATARYSGRSWPLKRPVE